MEYNCEKGTSLSYCIIPNNTLKLWLLGTDN